MANLFTHLNILSSITLATLLAGCGTADPTSEETVFSALPEWADPPAEHDDVTVNYTYQQDAFGKITSACEKSKHNVQKNFSEILALGDAYSDLKPGLVLQGKSVANGSMATVPLPRAPIQISINLAVKNPVRTIENPTSASIQAAIADLQREADSALGDLPALPAQVSFTSKQVDSFKEATLSVGVHAAYEGPLVSAKLDTSFSSSHSTKSRTVVAKLIQPMYTISISDDQLPSARSFFADDVTSKDFEDQVKAGTLGPDNLPTYVKSVTYGRIVIFTASSSTDTTDTTLIASVNASYMSFSGGVSLSDSQKKVLSTAQVEVLALGGDSTVASNAITTGNYSLFFAPATASTAVPLTYRINNLAHSRKPAVIGETTAYESLKCGDVTNCTAESFNQHPYVFCNNPMSNDAAATKCATLGLKLLRVDDAATDAWVRQEAHRNALSNFWTRAYNTALWHFSWSRDTNASLTYTNWNPGEPNNGGGNEYCLEIAPLAGWNDVACDQNRAYVCSQ